MDVVDSNNVVVEPMWPRTYVVPGDSEYRLAKVKAKHQYMAWSFQYQMSSSLGDPEAIPDEDYPYALPFAADEQYLISQGWLGAFSHSGEQNQFAIDITMPEGSDVLAARAGVVMDMAIDFTSGGTQQKNLQRGNYIRILHDDGTMAVYAHLKLESAQVAKGQRVEKGQKIAESGNTGFTTGPHLHFVVQINAGLKLVSIPFLLQHKDGSIKEPEVGPI